MLLGNDLSLAARVVSGARALLRPNHYPAGARRPRIVAHRGDARRTPENTLAACDAALAAGADGVELDLCITRDDVLVLWHDLDPSASVALYRQARIDGARFAPFAPSLGSASRRPIVELTFDEVRAHFGYVARGGERQPVERFDDVAAWLAATRADPLILDVKLRPKDADRTEAFATELARVGRAHPKLFARTVHVMTPEREIFMALKHAFAARPELTTLRLTADFELPGVVRTAQQIGARHVGIGTTVRRLWPSVRDEIACAVSARERGVLQSITVWTVENPRTLTELCRLGVDAVLTDDVPCAKRAFDAGGA